MIYDRDSFPGDDFDNIVSRCAELNRRFGGKRTFHAIWSNECFEVWLLFHYMFLSVGIPRDQYGAMLSQQIGREYQKTAPPDFAELELRLKDAIRNAKKQMKNFPESVPPSQRNPCTNFYELIENLMPYIEAARRQAAQEEKRMGGGKAVRRAKNSS